MIRLSFRFGGDYFEVVIDGNNIMFYDTSTGMMTTIEGLRLSKAGAIKEFPELKDDDGWREKVILNFKEKIKSLKTEDQKVGYVKKELTSYGYIPLMKQKAGFRTRKL